MERRDYNFPPFGTGILDFDSVLRLLSQGGYRGALTLEVELDGQPESPQRVDEALAMSIDYLRHRRSLPPGDLFTITLR
jgi:sugar phosphate isomerase/epimerase